MKEGRDFTKKMILIIVAVIFGDQVID